MAQKLGTGGGDVFLLFVDKLVNTSKYF